MIPTHRRLVTTYRGRSPSAMERLASAVLEQALKDRDHGFFDDGGVMLQFWTAAAGLRVGQVQTLARRALSGTGDDG